MEKQKTAHAYELELRKMIEARTGAKMEIWLTPQVRATAMNEVILDKMQDAMINDTRKLADWSDGSTGQMKYEEHPLLKTYNNLQRTLMMQFEALGLNYNTTPSKVKEDTKKGVDAEKDGLMSRISEVQGTMNEIPDDM
jgi:hypothetical protein